jgi:hypothetical protein
MKPEPQYHGSFDFTNFRLSVESYWVYHGQSRQLHWRVCNDENIFEAEAAPVFQEVFGGSSDGAITWSPYEFHLHDFIKHPGIEIEGLASVSYSVTRETGPLVGMTGTFMGKPFILRLHLEPLSGSLPREVYDVFKDEVRQKAVKDIELES